jgi:hypothetical protein
MRPRSLWLDGMPEFFCPPGERQDGKSVHVFISERGAPLSLQAMYRRVLAHILALTLRRGFFHAG